MWKRLIPYLRSKIARRKLRPILESIDEKIPSRSHYPDWGKQAFLRGLRPDVRVLDVGCGNNSPEFTKSILPDCYYVGLDVGDYNLENPEKADEYVIVSSERFAARITEFPEKFDAVISSHNLEHCDDRQAVLSAMAGALKPGGMLYLAFPCADSLTFPSRRGTLNYMDDGTHQGRPPDLGATLAALINNGCDIVYCASRYQPAVRWLIGLFHEERSSSTRSIDTETWAFWGFETVIWARRKT